ncbi:MAG TPA: GNAT family N-acetyltransferase [Thermoanaerobaculia bacterium]|nr:GNAT family N-acetyltransferase [Thermoanaerobaculia bacterium]
MSSPIDTARLRFGTWSTDDVEHALSLWGDAEVMRFIGGPYPREKAIARVEGEIANLEMYRVQYWPIFDTTGFAGVCGLRPREDIFTLGFHLLPSRWGRGYAAEASRAVIDYARDVLHAQQLYAGHHPQNEKSRRVLESLGFEYWREELYPPTGLMHKGYLLTL